MSVFIVRRAGCEQWENERGLGGSFFRQHQHHLSTFSAFCHRFLSSLVKMLRAEDEDDEDSFADRILT